MGLGLLPWERWLPPYIYGPLLSAISVYSLTMQSQIRWWEWIIWPLSFVSGVYCTWIWFAKGKNIFVDGSDELEEQDGQSATQKGEGSVD